MTIHLPEDLERFVHDQVRAGRYPSEAEVIRDALKHLQQVRQPPSAPEPTADPVLGAMRGDAEVLDQIVDEAMRNRREQSWRLSPGE